MESIGLLAGGVAHDFNNLLGIVIGSAEMLQADLPEDSALREYTADVLKAAHRAADLTRQLLAFGRQQVRQPKVLTLNALVLEFEKMLRRIIPENIEIRTALGSVGKVRADAGQIEQVIMNLVVNARDAMPQGGRLAIETSDVELDEQYARQHAAVKPGPYVMLAVSDTGHGMTPEVQARIFDPFYTTKERGKGTGLGLGSVHGIVKQSGGSMYVYSEPGRGATFKIYLPNVGTEVETSDFGSSPREMPRGSETILVAEDEAGLRRIMSELLKGLGYTVLLAEHGADALRVSDAYDGPIHLLVTDVIMPGIGGRELAARLVPSRSTLQVLYLSGYTDDSIIVEGVLTSEMAFLQKPFAGADLAQKVRGVLEAGPRSASPEL
jgi:CheY-like chemotaxis protein